MPTDANRAAPQNEQPEGPVRRIAKNHAQVSLSASEPRLLIQRRRQQRFLDQAYRAFAHRAQDKALATSQVAEWLLDNYHIVRRALRQIEEDMPKTFYAELPLLSEGRYADLPRAYAVAHAFLEETNGASVDVSRLERFVHAYQRVTPLRMGELWALPVMLRISVLSLLVAVIAGEVDVEAPVPNAPTPHIDVDHHSAATLTANCILTLRAVDAQDWRAFFEATSLVDRILARDPANTYRRMTFGTRDRYRKVVETLATRCDHSEVEVAERAVDLARAAQAEAASSLHPDTHVGYYLVDAGRPLLERRIAYTPSPRQRLSRWFFRDHPTLTYLGGICVLTLILLAVPLAYGWRVRAENWQMIVIGLLAAIPASSLALSLLNAILAHLIRPRRLPKLDLVNGVPRHARTMVVVPVLLSRADEVAGLLQQLELHYLRNTDPNIRFALLSDFADAPAQEMPDDDELLQRAQAGIRALNERYTNTPFYLFHRQRLWNAQEEIWMGWERKRGKLEEFNRLLLQEGATSFTVQRGGMEWLADVRYVITLDADTVLPRNAARRLIGTLAHPLNRAQREPDTGRIRAGYTVLQPRMEILPLSAGYSRFTRIFGGDIGLDLYTHAVSDVYQDLFGEGIYVGKGIYDVAAFAHSLAGRVPENSLLSHDLFEGIHGRVGLVTDITLYEDFPRNYASYAARLHRWIRGDWQLLPWLLPRVPQRGRGRVSNRFTPISYWKVIDNLRRTLVQPVLLVWLVLAWLWLPGSPLVWTVLAALTQGGALFGAQLGALIRRRDAAPSRFALPRKAQRQLGRWLLSLTFLPYEAALHLAAIVTTLGRLLVTRRHLLQWTSAAHTMRRLRRGQPLALWRQMISAPLLAAGIGILVTAIKPAAWPAALPFLGLWVASPQIAHWLSGRMVTETTQPLDEDQEQELRRLARHTWLYFEQFVGPEDHWLAPDHFQEDPRGIIAHRTSPTNIGLMLLSTLAAYDLGYVGLWELLLRLQNSLEGVEKLEKYAGHYLNWYDTRTHQPLPPKYVSTVDSGNLACCLLTLRQGCLAIDDSHLPRWERWQGLIDALEMLDAVLKDISDTVAVPQLRTQLATLRRRIQDAHDVPERWAALLQDMTTRAWPRFEQSLIDLIETHDLPPDQLRRLRLWSERPRNHLANMQRRLDALMPWSRYLLDPPALLATSRAEPLQAAWHAFETALPAQLPVATIPTLCREAQPMLDAVRDAIEAADAPQAAIEAARQWCRELSADMAAAAKTVTELRAAYRTMAGQLDNLINEMAFDFLYDEQRHVFHIGYNVSAEQPDPNYYDLLASEARAASLLAIAQGDVPERHWLHLGRPVTEVNGRRALLSWSGTMFEYLMPALWTRHDPDTFLDTTIRAAVDKQIAYVRHRDNVPWGISESGYYRFDANLNYQYRAFGVPGLGFMRNLGDDLVISPYASMLALTLRPQAVFDNLQHLIALGMLGDYGLYEAIDYTPTRLGLNEDHAIVRSYMVHHQGMILVSLVNALKDAPMVRRFHADPRIQSVELLLQEQIPHAAPLEDVASAETPPAQTTPEAISAEPWPVPVHTPSPQTHYLGNGRYGVLITNAGAGFDRWRDVDLTRWRADTTRDDWGTWIYIQDLDSGELWSAGAQPIAGRAQQHDVTFAPHKADFQYTGDTISTHMEITVAPDDDLAIRRVRLTNRSNETRRLRLVSYSEIVLTQQATDRRHPAFNKLFIPSSFDPEHNALLFTRRPRAATEDPPWMAHAVVLPGEKAATPTYETDRARFLGRNGSLRRPAALDTAALSGTTGNTLDPIMALGQIIELPPHAATDVAFLTLAAASSTALKTMLARYQDWTAIERAFQQAESRSVVELRELELDTDGLRHVQQLLGLLLYPHRALRADPEVLAANMQGQPGLWPHAISGDYPILLAQIAAEEELPLVRTLLQAHAYWRNRGLKIDLVLLNKQPGGYSEDLQMQIKRLVHRLDSDNWLYRRGGIFLLQDDQLNEHDRTLLLTAARAVVVGDRGPLAAQLHDVLTVPSRLPDFVPVHGDEQRPQTKPVSRRSDLLFDNGWGGFTPDGSEYIIFLSPGDVTPAPWANVIANPEAGCLVSETGGGYTWALNSGENRLTPWHNDPVRDRPGEALYLRDEESAEIWTPTPAPRGSDVPYRIHHGHGYTVFHHHSHGLKQRLRIFTAAADPVKIVQLRLENSWPRPRRLTATYYAEWVLGVDRDQMQAHIVPTYAADHHALLARNRYNVEFGERVAFVAADRPLHGLTADRSEFLGRLGDETAPAALHRVGLNSAVRPGLDPCAAIQLHVDLAPGEAKTICFFIGQAADGDAARAVIERLQAPGQVDAAWDTARTRWTDLLGAVTVKTPNKSMDLLLNGWLLYQNLSGRIWGRSGFYQSSGAYGFRDQLQDVLAVLHAAPDVARRHIVRAARHQFEAGDVLHWWHPPSGRGVRTRITDDLLWLPYVVAHYVQTTGDTTVLDVQAPFRRGDPLTADEEERYDHFPLTEDAFSIYEHCLRALEKGSTAGPHDLPLMGTGDWNDGMNRVGLEGEGESVWLGWFLYATLSAFAPVCEMRGHLEQAEAYRRQMAQLRDALEEHAWDGAWYLRAFYDDGTALGSADARECRIDAIAQSWAVLSGAGEPSRTRRALAAVDEMLVQQDDRLLLLFTPPFDKTVRDPGYIKGYPPGIRENGGQYTHAAVWTVWAHTQFGDGARAGRLFDLLNPINQSDSADKARRYRVEPYVTAADLYSTAPYVGRGGWTWYTGSGGWLYRLGLEAILGLRREGDTLRLAPCIPPAWAAYSLRVQLGDTVYHIEVKNPDGVSHGIGAVTLDGAPVPDQRIPLRDDGAEHHVTVRLAAEST